MLIQVRILYGTATGDYLKIECPLDHENLRYPDAFIQAWALRHLPQGSWIVRIETEWAALPAEELILRRLGIPGALRLLTVGERDTGFISHKASR